MTNIFISDIITDTERTAEIFFPDHNLCVRAVISIDHDKKGVKYLQVTLSGISSPAGKVYRGDHAARFLKYVATSFTSIPNEVSNLTQLAQNYIMIYKGKNMLNFNLAVPLNDWPLI